MAEFAKLVLLFAATLSCCLRSVSTQLSTPFNYQFDVVFMALNIIEVASRWDVDTAKAPSLQVVAEVLLRHVMGKIWGRRRRGCKHVGRAWANFLHVTLHHVKDPLGKARSGPRPPITKVPNLIYQIPICISTSSKDG